MRLKNKLLVSLVVISVFLIQHVGIRYLPPPHSYLELYLSRYLLRLVIIVLALWWLHKSFKIGLKAWGLNKPSWHPFLLALIFVSPMLIGNAWLADFKINISYTKFFQGCVLAALVEELLYRGFLFGQLFRFAGWGFIPAALANALVFGLGHLYQANNFGEAIGVFAVTALGGVWFAWLYVEWNNSLWLPIAMHFLMNLSWDLFNTNLNAAGDSFTNLFRGLTIALSIYYTIRYKRKNGGLTITLKKLLRNG